MANFSREDFKISFLNEVYDVNVKNRTITCTMEFSVNAPEGLFTLLNDKPGTTYITTGTARCAKEDRFDEAIGKKIARTRAENKAYLRVARGLEHIVDEYAGVLERCGDFKLKADKVVAHNIRYISRLEDKVRPEVHLKRRVANKDSEGLSDNSRSNVRRYTRNTPFGTVTVTERPITDEEVKKLQEDFDYRFNKLISEFQSHFPKLF